MNYKRNLMFLVLTRSPHRVDELSFLARRISTVETPYIEERNERIKIKEIYFSHAHLSHPSETEFFFFFILIIIIIIIII